MRRSTGFLGIFPSNRNAASLVLLGIAAVCVLPAAAPVHSTPTPTGQQFGEIVPKAGFTFQVGDKTFLITKLQTAPFVESEFTKRYRFDSFENPKLKELRERYGLDQVVQSGKSEFDRQVLLLDWAHRQFKKFGQPSAEVRGALDILEAIKQGHTFFCSQYADLFVSAAASLGWVDRPLALRRHQDKSGGGSTEHSVTEIWSDQFGKWVMMDPTANMHIEKNGIPLNAFEVRQEWFQYAGTNLVFCIGKEGKSYRKGDLPIFLERFAGFGDLTVPADELDKYGFIGYIPNTDLMDSGPDYGKMFITKDKLCEGTRWHIRPCPPNPAVDPYFPINQAALELHAERAGLRVKLKTLTPNFKTYQARIDGATWQNAEASFLWKLHDGINRLELKSLNQFGVAGFPSVIEIDQAATPEPGAPRLAPSS
jgi:hypothetical protein